ncbi:MAG: riboflavin synthase [Ferruginibacter sp.]|nr:riboflavin synthase [Ferruginibacter sp.]
MFTGIIENTGTITKVIPGGGNKTFWVASAISNELKVDQSLSHNGVCLTVEEIKDGLYRVTAIEETLLKTNINTWQAGSIINLERCMQLNGRLDGHLVQGHVDCTGQCLNIEEKEGSRQFIFQFPEEFAGYIIEKGSITINGISLTLFNVGTNSFTVAIIPYTYNNTNMNGLKTGDTVNLEFDVIGKYVNRIQLLK